MLGFSKIFLGILLGVFVIPFIYKDPVGTFLPTLDLFSSSMHDKYLAPRM